MKTAFFCVDAQFDFMDPSGKLYVKGAEATFPKIASLTSFAMQYRIPVIASRDWHHTRDPEFAMFPEHCVAGTTGAELIPASIAVGSGSQSRVIPDVVISKQNYDVFSNSCAAKVVAAIKSHQWFVYGVATDYCVKATVLGLRKMRRKVYVVTDAIQGVAEDTTKMAICEMKAVGAKFVTYDEAFPLL